MKCIFFISLLTSLICLTPLTQAHSSSETFVTFFKKKKSSEKRHPDTPNQKPSKSPSSSAEKKDEKPSTKDQTPMVTTKTVEQVIQETTDKTKMAQFGIAAMLKSFKEQAANNNNPDKALFERDAQIGREIMESMESTMSFNKIKHLVIKLDERTQKALLASIKQYPIFKQKSVADEFFKARI